MFENDPTRLMQRLGWFEGQRRPGEETMQEISDLLMPFRGDITTRQTPGQRRRPLYDSFGVMATDQFVNFLNGSLFPSSSDWVKLRSWGQEKYDRSVDIALDVSAARIMDALASSNFYVAAHTDTRDWGVLGNSTLYVQHDDEGSTEPGKFGGLIFDPVPWSRVWWQFSHIGRPLTIVREVEMPALDVVHFFDRSNDRIPTSITDTVKFDPYAMTKIVHFVQRNPLGRKGTANKPWVSHWISRNDAAVAMRTGGYNEQPYIAGRMMVMDGEQYGRGRGHIARPAAKGVNEITRQEFVALGKELNPPFLSEDDVAVNLDFTPGGHVVVRPHKEMAPGYLRSGTDFGLVETIRENLHAVIGKAFLADVLGEPDTQTRSAEAERSRFARSLSRMSAVSQTLEHEKLNPLITKVIDIMEPLGALPELTEVMRENPELSIVPVFSSPFFTAQKSQALLRVDSFLEKRLQKFERTSDPIWLEDIDVDALRRLEQELADVPAIIFKAIEEIDAIRDARGDRNADEFLASLAGRAGKSATNVQLRPGGSRAASAGDLLSPPLVAS